jgi:hypothetical protein
MVGESSTIRIRGMNVRKAYGSWSVVRPFTSLLRRVGEDA